MEENKAGQFGRRGQIGNSEGHGTRHLGHTIASFACLVGHGCELGDSGGEISACQRRQQTICKGSITYVLELRCRGSGYPLIGFLKLFVGFLDFDVSFVNIFRQLIDTVRGVHNLFHHNVLPTLDAKVIDKKQAGNDTKHNKNSDCVDERIVREKIIFVILWMEIEWEFRKSCSFVV